MKQTFELLALAKKRASLALRESLTEKTTPDLEPVVKRLELIIKAEGILGNRNRRDKSLATLLALTVTCFIALSLAVHEQSGWISLGAKTTALSLQGAELASLGGLTLSNASIAVSGSSSGATGGRLDLRDQALIKLSQFEVLASKDRGKSTDSPSVEISRDPKCIHITTYSSDVSGSLLFKSGPNAIPDILPLRYSAEERSPLTVLACGSLETPWRLRTRQHRLTLGETIRYGVGESSVVSSTKELAVSVDGVKIDASPDEVVNVVYDLGSRAATEFSSLTLEPGGQIAVDSSAEIVSLTTGSRSRPRERMPNMFQLLVENKAIVAIVTFAITAIGLLWKLGKFFAD